MKHARSGKRAGHRTGVSEAAEPSVDTNDAERIVEELYARRLVQLLASARRALGDQPSAEDVVHDAFTRLWRMLVTRKRPQKIEAMLFVLFRHALVDEQRRRRSRRRGLMRLARRGLPAIAQSINPTARLERAEARAEAMRALRTSRVANGRS